MIPYSQIVYQWAGSTGDRNCSQRKRLEELFRIGSSFKDEVFETRIRRYIPDRDLGNDIQQEMEIKLRNRILVKGKIFDSENHLKNFYKVMCQNRAKDLRKKVNNERVIDFNWNQFKGTEKPSIEDFENEFPDLGIISLKCLTKLLEELPEEEFEILDLRFYDELSWKVIGKKLGYKANTACNKCHRIIKKLRKKIEACLQAS